MNLADRIKSFEILGERLRSYHETLADPGLSALAGASKIAFARNPWLTPELVRIALNNLGKALSPENLSAWLAPYAGRLEQAHTQKRIGVVMAGNIPAVGFHDFLCVLISGNKIVAKLSSSDDQLLPAMATILTGHMPEWQEYITFTSGKLEHFDAIIATGSTNTSRYFEFYFGRYPHIIRKSRNSIAVLDGNESMIDLQHLADDIMLFFGMGCRSISKIYVPDGYDFSSLIEALGKYGFYADHHKYRNNYDYNKSIFLVSQVPFIDAGFLMLKEDQSISSRIGLLNYEYYSVPDKVAVAIAESSEAVQCVVSNMRLPFKTVPPGEGQNPALWDYADHLDTMEFLLSSF
ncbi:MAG: acyl-CoA reductase [Bacteroidetes bacterium]|nr:acyl-CoA reductase [Bacteroidota bacterium]